MGFLSICLLMFSLPVTWRAGPEAAPLFKLDIAAPKEPLKPGAELQLRVKVTNTSNRRIDFLSSPGEIPENSFYYKITVTDAAGKSAPLSDYVKKLDSRTPIYFGSRVSRSIMPQGFFLEVVDVTRYFSLARPGKYTVSVSRPYPPRQNLGSGQIESNKIIVAVTK